MLSGDLSTLDLADLLQWVSARKKTGTLLLTRRSTRKTLVVRDGSIASSASNDPREALGQYLTRERLISEEALFNALLAQERDRRLLGAILIAEGHLVPLQLKSALEAVAQEIVYDLFLWPDGSFEFKDDATPTHLHVELGLDPVNVTQEGGRRRKEWRRFRQRFPSAAITFREQASGRDLVEPAELPIVELARAGKTLAEISLHTRRSEYDTAAQLYDLCDRGALVVHDLIDRPVAQDSVGTIQQLLAVAAERLDDGRFDAALRAYEEVLSFDALNQQAKKGIVAVSEGRKRERVRRRIPMEKVPYLCLSSMALTQETFDPHEGFLLSRINGQWDVQSILKLCPMTEEEALDIFGRLLDRKVVELR